MLAALSAFAQGYAEREKTTHGIAVHVSEKNQQVLKSPAPAKLCSMASRISLGISLGQIPLKE